MAATPVALATTAALLWIGGPAQANVSSAANSAAASPARHASLRPCGMKFAIGGLYVGDSNTVRRIGLRTGQFTTAARGLRDGTYIDEGYELPAGACGVAVDSAGNLVIAAGDRVLVEARRSGRFYGRRMTAGHVYVTAGERGQQRDYAENGDGGLATKALLGNAVDVQLDRAGNVVVADSGMPPFHEGAPIGAMVRVVAEKTGEFYGRKMTAGHIYAVAGVGAPWQRRPGGAAALTSLGQTIGNVRVDANGNLVIADQSGSDLAAGAAILVVAARSGTFYGRKMAAGHIYVVAGDDRSGDRGDGGPAVDAALTYGGAVTIDKTGNLLIADCGRIRVVAARTGRFYGRSMQAHDIYSVAGAGPAGGDGTACTGNLHDAGDGGPARRAEIIASWVTVDSAGNILIAEPTRVRAIAARTGSFYGVKMHKGDIYTIAGTGR